jgi:hypothetical protein
VGDNDARKLSEGFSTFEANDIQSLATGEALCRIERSDFDFNLSVALPKPPETDTESQSRERVIQASREQFATPRKEIEAALRERLEAQPQEKTRDTPAPVPPKAEVKPAKPEPAPQENKHPEIRLTAAAETPPSQTTPDMGRGGVQHKAIQQRLKAVAEELGFRAIVEKHVLDGQGSIDLVLEKPGHAIACEINVTSTVDYEVGNVTKCLRAGFAQVAVICPRPNTLARLREAVNGCLAPEEASKISFHSPEDFIAHLQSATIEEPASQQTSAPTEERKRGYKVRRHFVEVSPEDAKAREDAAIRMLAEKMRRPSR